MGSEGIRSYYYPKFSLNCFIPPLSALLPELTATLVQTTFFGFVLSLPSHIAVIMEICSVVFRAFRLVSKDELDLFPQFEPVRGRPTFLTFSLMNKIVIKGVRVKVFLKMLELFPYLPLDYTVYLIQNVAELYCEGEDKHDVCISRNFLFKLRVKILFKWLFYLTQNNFLEHLCMCTVGSYALLSVCP